MSEPPEFEQLVSEGWPYDDSPSFGSILTEPWSYFEPVGEISKVEGSLRLVKIEVGQSSIVHSNILNCKSIKWRNVHAFTPRVLPSAKIPTGLSQSHMWIEGEFELQTKDALVDFYAPENADAILIPYFAIFTETKDKRLLKYTFDGLIISNVERGLDTENEPVFVYKFLAYSFIATSDWYRRVYEPWGVREPPAMDQLVDEVWLYEEPPSTDQIESEPWSE